MLRRSDAAVDTPPFADGLKTPLRLSETFGVAQKEVTPVPNRKRQQRKDPLLGFRLEIDQQITAGTEVHSREGRIAQQILRCKHHQFANLFLDSIGVVVLIKETLEALLREIPFNAGRINTCAGARK